jgi:hypothetical protein
MVGTMRRRLGATVAMGLVVAGVVAASSFTASGQDAEPFDPNASQAQVAGTLQIVLTPERTGYVELTLDGDAGGYQTVRQDLLTTEPCAKLEFEPLPGGKDLLTLTPIVGNVTTADDSVQIPSDYLGVHRGTNCGGPAGQIGPDEQLKIALGPYFVGTVMATEANLRIRKTNTADGSLQYKLDDDAYSLPVNVDVATSYPINVKPEDSFRAITIKSTASNKSRGLSVGTLTQFRLTNLISETQFDVDCGQKITQIGDKDEGDVATKVVYFRGENSKIVDDADECVEVNATVQIVKGDDTAPDGLPDYVFWDNDIDDGNGRVNATIEIEWAPKPCVDADGEVSSCADTVGEPTLIDYDGYGPGGFTEALWCPRFSQSVDVNGKVTFDAILPMLDEIQQDDGTSYDPKRYPPGANEDGTAPWCIAGRSEVLDVVEEEVSTGVYLLKPVVVKTDTFFGSGDPKGLG